MEHNFTHHKQLYDNIIVSLIPPSLEEVLYIVNETLVKRFFSLFTNEIMLDISFIKQLRSITNINCNFTRNNYSINGLLSISLFVNCEKIIN